MPKIYELYQEQTLATDLDTAWDFIRSPKNLDRITPDDMAFEIVSPLPDEMYDGLLIEYRVGIPMIGKQTWLTEIKHIRDHHSFVDEQRIGPYKIWYHYHQIEAVAGGVRFVDHVNYVMPLGLLGQFIRTLYVRKQLENIFNFRRTAMEEHLGHN